MKRNNPLKEKFYTIIKKDLDMSYPEFVKKGTGLKISNFSFYQWRKKLRQELGVQSSTYKKYTRNAIYHVLWSKDVSKIKPETIAVINELLQVLKKKKRMNLEIIQTVSPAKLEIREHS